MTLNTILFYPIFFFFNQLEIMIFFLFSIRHLLEAYEMSCSTNDCDATIWDL